MTHTPTTSPFRDTPSNGVFNPLTANLDVGGFDIVSTSNGNIELKPDGSGSIDLTATTGPVDIITTSANVTFTTTSGDFVFSGGNIQLGDNERIDMGDAQDSSITFDGSDMLFSADHVAGGSYVFEVTSNTTGLKLYDPGSSESIAEILRVNADSGRLRLFDGNATKIQFHAHASNNSYIKTDGNFGLGTSSFNGAASKCFSIANGTAPGSATSNQVYFYATSGEAYVMDDSGNATLLSPHNNEGEWVYYSVNKKTGRRVQVNMERVIKALEKLIGEQFLQEDFVA